MRHILHVDQNCYYASVEMQRHPELRNKPLAVCGSQEARHGIVLTANYLAKPRGVKTGMAIWQARQHCPDLVVLPPDMPEYDFLLGYVRKYACDNRRCRLLPEQIKKAHSYTPLDDFC